MLEHALAGKRVVRLKGGDPFVFGRGGEELEFLRGARHPLRGRARHHRRAGLRRLCRHPADPSRPRAIGAPGHRALPRQSLDELDWPALAQERQTLAVYMGVAGLDGLRAQLLAHGRAAGTPFALIENGSRREQRVILGTLDDLPERATSRSRASPALLILGEVAALARTPALVRRTPLCLPHSPQGRTSHGPLRQHPRHHRQYADRQAPPARPETRLALRQGRSLQSRRLGKGSPGAGDRPRRRAQRRAQARADRSSKPPPAIPASRWRWSPPPAAIRSSR